LLRGHAREKRIIEIERDEIRKRTDFERAHRLAERAAPALAA
jgi:hypothetical protein